MLCNKDSEDVTTKYHLVKVKPTFGDEASEASTPTNSARGDQKAKRVEVKKEDRKSLDRAMQSCDGARNATAETNQRRRALFLTAGHLVTLNAQKMTDYAGTPLEGKKKNVNMVKLKRRLNQCSLSVMLSNETIFIVELPSYAIAKKKPENVKKKNAQIGSSR